MQHSVPDFATMIRQFALRLPAFPRGCHLITREVLEQIELPAFGLFHLFIQHTSAGLTLNENADPTVRHDMRTALDRMVPDGAAWMTHTSEGPDDMPAHVKSSLVGSALSIPITEYRLNLGTWQGIYLCEFRHHAGERNLVATVWGD